MFDGFYGVEATAWKQSYNEKTVLDSSFEFQSSARVFAELCRIFYWQYYVSESSEAKSSVGQPVARF
jgi:hypothetical protein